MIELLSPHPSEQAAALQPPCDFLLVYQMGKVGSMSIVKSLRQIYRTTIYHVHCLQKERLAHMRTMLPESQPHIRESLSLQSVLDGGIEGKTWKIISLVRDPVARNVSGFFQNLGLFVKDIPSEITRETVADAMQRFLQQYSHDVPLSWFDNEMLPVFGINVFAKKFPYERGYSIIEKGGVGLLLIRLEDLDRCAADAFSDFLGIRNFTPSKENTGTGKKSGDFYKHFRSKIQLPREYLDTMYSSKFAQHFYTPLETRGFWKEWNRDEWLGA